MRDDDPLAITPSWPVVKEAQTVGSTKRWPVVVRGQVGMSKNTPPAERPPETNEECCCGE